MRGEERGGGRRDRRGEEAGGRREGRRQEAEERAKGRARKTEGRGERARIGKTKGLKTRSIEK